jgi:hypothetical protein
MPFSSTCAQVELLTKICILFIQQYTPIAECAVLLNTLLLIALSDRRVNIYEGQDRIASDKYNVLPPPMLVSHGWEEEAHPWPLAEPPDVISSSQESASSSAPLVPYGEPDRTTCVVLRSLFLGS